MADETPRPSSAMAQRLSDIAGPTRLINGIFAALSSSIETRDLHLIILAILTTPRGLGFTRARLFAVGEDSQQHWGQMALGAQSERDLARLNETIDVEESLLDQMAKGSTRGKRQLRDLHSQTWWITAYQLAEVENPLTEKIRGIPLFKTPMKRPPSLLARNDRSEIKAIHVRGGQAPKYFDSKTVKLLGDDFVVGPLKTQRGVRAIIVADKAFQPDGITDADVSNFEWLCAQAGWALDNAELYDNLRHAYEELEEMDAMKSNFLSIISHELRTPLTSILGFVQLIRDGKVGEVNANIVRLLDRVVVKSRDLSSMINDLLEIAEIHAGGLVRADLGPIEVEPVVEHAIQRVEQRGREIDVKIENHPADAPLPLVLGDDQALLRILYHLIDNGVKFNHNGGKVVVRQRATSKSVEIAIRDTGIGMREEDIEKVYSDFFQLDGDLDRQYSGAGLGLTIAKKLLTVIGGHLQVQSTLGKGTTIRLTLPIATKDDNGKG